MCFCSAVGTLSFSNFFPYEGQRSLRRGAGGPFGEGPAVPSARGRRSLQRGAGGPFNVGPAVPSARGRRHSPTSSPPSTHGPSLPVPRKRNRHQQQHRCVLSPAAVTCKQQQQQQRGARIGEPAAPSTRSSGEPRVSTGPSCAADPTTGPHSRTHRLGSIG
ncbi:hypothetical protein EYF80_030352 [Liparis tanakae]|uniref:Uncharacterized protein n=1 Tax=Liparis tanakae TaxID=230148 RepID=A0A4Z2H0P1_9TELE|nr:hypothetical protein EYF80_030352 [Liparis tanakae]